jgi:hypothetical protein
MSRHKKFSLKPRKSSAGFAVIVKHLFISPNKNPSFLSKSAGNAGFAGGGTIVWRKSKIKKMVFLEKVFLTTLQIPQIPQINQP